MSPYEEAAPVLINAAGPSETVAIESRPDIAEVLSMLDLKPCCQTDLGTTFETIPIQNLASQEFFGSYPGFKPLPADRNSKAVADTVRGRLTQSLDLIIEELADEISKAVDELFGNPETWAEIEYKLKLLQLIVRVLPRVFVGPELCTNEDWLRISKKYAWFQAQCRNLRTTLHEAHMIVMLVIENRREPNRQAHEAGKSTSKTADPIGWMDEAANGQPYDVTTAQLGLSLAAIHTTTELVSGIISDLCTECFELLREEIVS
ncbi:hypothetical protein BDV23DRAFT_188145 [Aspergillus alliaceus]|uniref:Uncharacterized protein n=1 Tax=Petromyces alliaceus TaxID=209559 RepID=A0A5N7BUX5_PETAA|nr:hypothetical protein BDV23DRAFT_188145 [Aspergillus alliaceus]